MNTIKTSLNCSDCITLDHKLLVNLALFPCHHVLASQTLLHHLKLQSARIWTEQIHSRYQGLHKSKRFCHTQQHSSRKGCTKSISSFWWSYNIMWCLKSLMSLLSGSGNSRTILLAKNGTRHSQNCFATANYLEECFRKWTTSLILISQSLPSQRFQPLLLLWKNDFWK